MSSSASAASSLLAVASVHRGYRALRTGVAQRSGRLANILWILAVILVLGGVVTLIRGRVLAGLALIVLGFLVGPGGVSIFT